VTGGNVSFYNESPAGQILPTPQIGVVGLLDDIDRLVGPGFRGPGDAVVLLGEALPGLAGSQYAALAGLVVEERLPSLDLKREAALQRLLVEAAAAGLLASAQDVSGGGLAVAIAECAIWGGTGATLTIRFGAEPAVELFGESPSRAVVTAHPADVDRLVALAGSHGVPLETMGETGGDRLVIALTGSGATGAAEERGASVADALEVAVADLRRAWEQALPRALGDESFVPPVLALPAAADAVRGDSAHAAASAGPRETADAPAPAAPPIAHARPATPSPTRGTDDVTGER